MTTLLFLDPGHFHAALTLRSRNPRVSRDVYVYARKGAELNAFTALVESFNLRAELPTSWQVHVRESSDPAQALIEERAGTLAVLAGRNDTKLERIAQLHAAGISVLADKPWLVDPRDLPHLDEVTAGPPVAMDIMTSRHDVYARLRKAVTKSRELFGDFQRAAGGPPGIEIESVHHLHKVVNGVPLARPVWYFDTDVQGDGLTDIQSHMTDQVQWLLEEAGEDSVPVESARLWDTVVPLDLYRDITGRSAFDPTLARYVRDGALGLAANGELTYSLGGVRVLQRAQWRQREPAGGGDLMSATVRGTRSTIRMSQGPETQFKVSMVLMPSDGEQAFEARLRAAVAGWQGEFPGLGFEQLGGAGFALVVPPALQTGHEAHFAMVLDECLDLMGKTPWPPLLGRRLRFRYGLLARAKQAAQGARA